MEGIEAFSDDRFMKAEKKAVEGEDWVEVEVCVEAELAEVIRERAVAEGVSEGDVVREAVLRYLDVLEGVDPPA